jgi:hypothetical protein
LFLLNYDAPFTFKKGNNTRKSERKYMKTIKRLWVRSPALPNFKVNDNNNHNNNNDNNNNNNNNKVLTVMTKISPD